MNANANITTHEPTQLPAPAGDAASLLTIIERAAANPNVDVEKFERLMLMRERLDLAEAKRAFNESVSAAKSEIGPIQKNRVVSYGEGSKKTEYRHEDFAEIARTISPVLAKQGLAYRFRSSQGEGRIRVTCVISQGGYSEETTLEASADASGGKNAIQAIGSAVTYLQRYTLKLALGLAASYDDDALSSDGRDDDCGSDVIGSDDVEYVRRLIDETNSDEAKFLAHYKAESIETMTAAQFKRAIDGLNKKLQGVK